jgi:hypothetical protein
VQRCNDATPTGSAASDAIFAGTADKITERSAIDEGFIFAV